MEKFKVKTTDKKIIEVTEKLVKKPKTQTKAPAWFTQWSESFETRINKRFEEVDAKFEKLETEISQIKRVLKRNNLK